MKIILTNQFKNESLRIVEWLEYYRDRGIKDFILINDNSTDDSIQKINSVPNVSVTMINFDLPEVNFSAPIRLKNIGTMRSFKDRLRTTLIEFLIL